MALAFCFTSPALVLAQYGGSPGPSPAPTAAASTNPNYQVTDLVGDIAGSAIHTDKRLINSWGMVIDHNLLMVTDNGTGLVTAYGPGNGTPARKAILVPPPAGQPGPAAPDGLALNPTQEFLIGSGAQKKPAELFIVTEDGTLSAWNSASGTNALLLLDNSGSNAVYKGVAVGVTSNGPMLYLANFRSNTVEVYNSSFAPLGSFADTNLTALGFAPFNLRVVQDKLVVAFAKQDAEHHDDAPGPGFGYIDVFNLDGTLVRNFTAQGALNSPWGLAIAPLRFGKFSQALLIGNFGDGWINAYNLFTGEYLGPLTDSSGSPLAIPGLWGLTFNTEPAANDLEYTATTLYFAAGPNGEQDGLVGTIKPLSPMYPPVH